MGALNIYLFPLRLRFEFEGGYLRSFKATKELRDGNCETGRLFTKFLCDSSGTYRS
jgi:hypothetical protein